MPETRIKGGRVLDIPGDRLDLACLNTVIDCAKAREVKDSALIDNCWCCETMNPLIEVIQGFFPKANLTIIGECRTDSNNFAHLIIGLYNITMAIPAKPVPAYCALSSFDLNMRAGLAMGAGCAFIGDRHNRAIG